jgi:DNA-binding NtrC family response regulator
MRQFLQVSISSASRRRLARHLVGLPLRDIERDLVLETLARTDGNRTVSARLLGLSIRTLRNKITEYSADGVEVTPAGGADKGLPDWRPDDGDLG